LRNGRSGNKKWDMKKEEEERKWKKKVESWVL
jgi:hypothetical protein